MLSTYPGALIRLFNFKPSSFGQIEPRVVVSNRKTGSNLCLRNVLEQGSNRKSKPRDIRIFRSFDYERQSGLRPELAA
jgi:hypothetical protein